MGPPQLLLLLRALLCCLLRSLFTNSNDRPCCVGWVDFSLPTLGDA
jgi:hypothetical protein